VKEVKAQFGQRLRELRLANGITQEQLAELSGLSYKFIGEIERGHGNPTLVTLRQLSIGLGLEMHDFFVAPARDDHPDVVYRLRKQELQAVREALRAADVLLNRLAPVPRRRRRLKSRHRA
jgi:transcriptional regulator with XRE-family HTH domain